MASSIGDTAFDLQVLPSLYFLLFLLQPSSTPTLRSSTCTLQSTTFINHLSLLLLPNLQYQLQSTPPSIPSTSSPFNYLQSPFLVPRPTRHSLPSNTNLRPPTNPSQYSCTTSLESIPLCRPPPSAKTPSSWSLQ